MKTHTMTCTLMLCLVLICPARSGAQVITGEETTYRVVEGDSLLLISAKLGVDVKELAKQNDLDPDQLLQPGLELNVSTRKIAPKVLENGIVIDIPGRMLYYFKTGKLAISFPVGLGMRSWRTPARAFTVTGKEQNPVWYVPESIQRQMQSQGMPVVTEVPPGPDNPLGRFALYTSMKGVCIHETIWPTTVYQFRSHGCIRVLSRNIELLYWELEKETPGESVYEPVKAAVTADGKVFLQVDPDIYGKAGDPRDRVMQRFAELGVSALVDWNKVGTALDDESGIAVDVTGGYTLLPGW